MKMKVLSIISLLVPLVTLVGCGPNHEAKIRERVTQLAVYSCSNDLDGCVQITDPVFVRSQGVAAVKARYKLLNAFVRLGQLTPDKIRIDSIEVAENGKSAQVGISFMVDDEWRKRDPARWVYHEGQWYVAL